MKASYMMAKFDAAFVESFETKLGELHPDVFTTGVVSRAQLMETMEALGTTKFPSWLMVNKAGVENSDRDKQLEMATLPE